MNYYSLTKKKFIALIVVLMLPIVSCSILTQPFASPQTSQPPVVSIDNLKQHVVYFSETVYPRSYDQEKNINLAADYIKKHFEQNSTRVHEQTFVVRGKTYRNIIARFGPENGIPIIVGAHYDSYGNPAAAPEDSDYSPHSHTPGADDNASGIAGLLELARLLKETPPTHPIELIAYTLEEPPFFRTAQMGSAVHANALKNEKRQIELMIALEMIGYFKDEPGSQTYPVKFLSRLYPDTGNFIAVIGRLKERKQTRKVKALMMGATDLPVQSINAPNVIEGLDFSDHRNYWQAGFPAIMITDTAFLRNHNYHTAEDTVESLDYERMAKVVQGTFAIIQNYK